MQKKRFREVLSPRKVLFFPQLDDSTYHTKRIEDVLPWVVFYDRASLMAGTPSYHQGLRAKYAEMYICGTNTRVSFNYNL